MARRLMAYHVIFFIRLRGRVNHPNLRNPTVSLAFFLFSYVKNIAYPCIVSVSHYLGSNFNNDIFNLLTINKKNN